jgi:hypothetical protein
MKMNEKNMEFWEKVKKTDPKRVKAITGKQYKGNSPQPYYLVERMTQEFGMCGIGWGLNIISERMERLSDTDVLHVAVVELWYVKDDIKGAITQIGQTKALYKKNDGGLMVDEDAPKKSVTDAMSTCMSYLGCAGDIFSGQWDDSKYVQELTKEFNKPASIQNTEAPRPVFTTERLTAIQVAVEAAVDAYKVGNISAAHDYVYGLKDNEEIGEAWGKLKEYSGMRSAIKKYREENVTNQQKEAA